MLREALKTVSERRISKVYIDCVNDKMISIVKDLGFENLKERWYVKEEIDAGVEIEDFEIYNTTRRSTLQEGESLNW